MVDFLLYVVAACVVAGIVFGVAAFTLGRDRGLTPPRPDGVPRDLPADRPVTDRDLRELRFDTAVRGYRMDQVDVVLERLRHDLGVLWAHVDDLERRDTSPPPGGWGPDPAGGTARPHGEPVAGARAADGPTLGTPADDPRGDGDPLPAEDGDPLPAENGDGPAAGARPAGTRDDDAVEADGAGADRPDGDRFARFGGLPGDRSVAGE